MSFLAPALLVAALFATTSIRDVPAKPGKSVLVSFHRSGGIAGRDDRATVLADRRVTVRSDRSATRRWRLSVAAMRKLRQSLDAARVDRSLPHSAPGGCADCLSYTITYRRHRVELTDDRVPARMRPALSRLSRLVDR
jgi:hypothetical protein